MGGEMAGKCFIPLQSGHLVKQKNFRRHFMTQSLHRRKGSQESVMTALGGRLTQSGHFRRVYGCTISQHDISRILMQR